MLFHMVGQLAEEDVGSHLMRQTVVDGPDAKVDGLRGPKSPLGRGGSLVCFHRLRTGQDLGRYAGTDHIQAIKSRLFFAMLA